LGGVSPVGRPAGGVVGGTFSFVLLPLSPVPDIGSKVGFPLIADGNDKAEKLDARLERLRMTKRKMDAPLRMWREDEEKDGFPIKTVGNDGVRMVDY